MKNGKLSNSDVKLNFNFITLEEKDRGLFKPFVNQKIRIVDQDDYEFYFDVTRCNRQLRLYHTKDFVNQWNLKAGDVLSFNYNSDICSFTVDVKGIGQERKETSNSLPKTVTIDEKNKTDILSTISQTYQSVIDEYNNTFVRNCYLPTKSTQSSLVINGFTERNLTFNFCHSYLKRKPNAIVWQEVPIHSVNRQHVDSIIIDNDWIIFIEAKRLYDLTHFELLLKDLDRIMKLHSEIPLPPKHPTNKAVVLLADHYFNGESKKKKDKEEIYDLFFSGQHVIADPEILNDHPGLKEINSTKINKVDINDRSINISRDNNYNIGVRDDLVYTIYCGVCFLGETEKK